MSEIMEPIFEDVPNIMQMGSAIGVWQVRLEPLLARPGDWARVHSTGASQTAANAAVHLRRRMVRIPRPDDDWEFASRTVDGHHYVYARYMGPKAAK